MDVISDAAELWLGMLEDEFWCEIANHAIGSKHVKYPSGTEARRAMLRKAYLKGAADARTQIGVDESSDFDRDIAKVIATNRGRRHG